MRITRDDLQPKKSKTVTIRVQASVLKKLKSEARSLGIGHTSLARVILEKWVDGLAASRPLNSSRASSSGQGPSSTTR